MHLHILGICGTFMGGLAVIAREAGHKVTGCDANVYPPMSTQLEQQGIELIEGYDAEQIALDPDVYVIGNVIMRGNPLMEAILEQGLPYVSGPQWLRENVLHERWVLAVAGTHGKTTTSAMLAWILEHAGLKPGVPDRRRAAELRRVRADVRHAFFRDRGRRVRHRVFRQALEVRPLPARARRSSITSSSITPTSFRISRRSRRSSITSCARCRQTALIVSNAREAALERVLARECWTPGRALRYAGRLARARARRARRVRGVTSGARRRHGALEASRRAQPLECAGGDRRREARRRSAGAPRSKRSRISRT